MSGGLKWTGTLVLGLALVFLIEVWQDQKHPAPRPLVPQFPPLHMVNVTIDGKLFIVPIWGTNVAVTVDK